MSTMTHTTRFGDDVYPIECFADDFMERRLRRGLPYEHRELSDLHALFSKTGIDGIALDVGANIGNHTLAFARMGFAEVVAYEMLPETRAVLERNLARACTVRSKIIGAVVSDARRDAMPSFALKRYWKNRGSTALVSDTSSTLDLPSVTLDDYDGPDVGFVKVDVEGHEASVLRGGQAFFEDHRPVLMIEVWKRHRTEVFGLLATMGYHDPIRMRGEFGDNFLVAPERGWWIRRSTLLTHFPRRRSS